MRLDLFEALAPVCPRCLHADGLEAPITVAEVGERRGDHLWHAILHCSNTRCWTEFPVVDGVPLLVADPAAAASGARHQLLMRNDLPATLTSLLGDAIGPSGEFDAARQHLSLYAQAHYGDLSCDADPGEPSSLASLVNAALDALGAAKGPALDLGGSVGRGGLELYRRGTGPVIVADLNLSMLRLGQTLALQGTAQYARRRVGLAYDPVRLTLPAALSHAAVDFWALDCLALPFRAGAFGTALAVNLVDCVAGPTELIGELARTLAPGGGAVVASPFDWSPAATEPKRWLGGHSQRGPTRGASEPALRATLDHFGLGPVGEPLELPWVLRLNERARMTYTVHTIACRKAA